MRLKFSLLFHPENNYVIDFRNEHLTRIVLVECYFYHIQSSSFTMKSQSSINFREMCEDIELHEMMEQSQMKYKTQKFPRIHA